jgi:hypothetical protein
MKDIRGLPKKNGAGGANWGKEYEEEELTSPDRMESTKGVGVKVVNEKEFNKLKK